MRSFFAVCLLLCSVAFVDAQTSSNDIVLGKIDSLYSPTLHETRALWIYTPHGGAGDIYSGQHYPVVYLLDGDAHLYSVVVKMLGSGKKDISVPVSSVSPMEQLFLQPFPTAYLSLACP